MNGFHRAWTRAGVLAFSGLMASATAVAGHIAIDFGYNQNDGQNFPFTASTDTTSCADGSSLAASCMVNLAGNQSSTAINLGFNIQIGSNTFSSLFINENGAVSFGGALPSGSFTSVSSLSGLISGPVTGVIAPLYTDLTTNTIVSGPADPGQESGSVFYGRGAVDLNGPPFAADASGATTPAFYVAWIDALAPDATAISTQLLIYSLGGGNFDLRLNYGQNDTDTIAASEGLAGFDLGTGGAVSTTGTLAASTDYFYQFQNGVLATGGTTGGGGGTTLPEPSTTGALLFAFALIGAWSWRMRRATSRAARR